MFLVLQIADDNEHLKTRTAGNHKDNLFVFCMEIIIFHTMQKNTVLVPSQCIYQLLRLQLLGAN